MSCVRSFDTFPPVHCSGKFSLSAVETPPGPEKKIFTGWYWATDNLGSQSIWMTWTYPFVELMGWNHTNPQPCGPNCHGFVSALDTNLMWNQLKEATAKQGCFVKADLVCWQVYWKIPNQSGVYSREIENQWHKFQARNHGVPQIIME